MAGTTTDRALFTRFAPVKAKTCEKNRKPQEQDAYEIKEYKGERQ